MYQEEPKCELCRLHEPVYKVEIVDSHPFSPVPNIMKLCKYCYDFLREEKVRIVILDGRETTE